MNLEEYLKNYRDITIQLINNVNKEDKLNALLEKRQNIIDNMKTSNFEREEIQKLIKSLGILQLEQKLIISLDEEKKIVKEQIRCLKITKEARTKYENTQFKPNFFNKKI